MIRIFLLSFLLLAGYGTLIPLDAAATGENNRLRVGFFAFSGYHAINHEQEKTGYGYEYLQRMASYTGWEYEYVGYDSNWSDMERMLADGKIDLVTGAVKTPERLARFAFSDLPLGTSYSCLNVRAGSTRFLSGDYANWSGMRVGMLRDKSWNDTFTQFAAQKGFTFVPVYFDDVKALEEALQKGEVDTLLSSSLRKPRNEWIYERFAPEPFYVMVKAGNAALLERINSTLEQLALDSPLLADELMGRYYSPDLTGIPYSVEERQFIEQSRAEKRVFYALLNPDRPPFAEYKDGEVRGVLVDIAKRIAERTGLDIRLLKLTTREEYMQEVYSGNREVMFDAWHDYSNAEKRKFHLTSAYYSTAVSRIRLKTFTGEPQSIAVVSKSNIEASLLRNGRPLAKIVTYETFEAVIQAVADGRQDVGYVNTLTAETAIYRNAASGLTAELVPGMTSSFAAAIRYGSDPRLISIVTKAVKSLSTTEVDDIVADFNARRPQVFSLWGWISVNSLKSLAVLASVLLLVIFTLSALLLARRKVYRLARITGQLPLHYFVVDRAGQILLHSGSAEIEDCNLRTLMQTAVAAAIDSGEPQTVNFESGASKYSAQITKLPYELFRRECAVWISQDTTELQEAREEARTRAEHLKKALVQAQAADRAKSFFLASMSHEIRTPLNAVIGLSELLKDQTLPAATRQDYLTAISSGGNALLALINDVLDLSKLEADQMVFTPVETDFAALVSEVASIFRQKCREHNLYLKESVPVLPKIDLDTLRVRQILFNLVGNAVKFTKCGGIEIAVEFHPDTASNGTLVFRVADTGVGISEGDRKLLFQPFVQSNAMRGTHAANNGTGLGLAIIDRMLSKMNGSIKLDSELGRGSVFTVTLHDLHYHAAVPPASAASDTAAPPAPVAVLLVDDVKMNLKVMSAMLRRLGIEASAVESGAEALATLERRTFDFLLTDLWMPGMNGAELAQHVRASGRFPAMRIAAVTADVESRQNFDMTVFDAILFKPVTMEHVAEILRTTAPRSGGGGQSGPAPDR